MHGERVDRDVQSRAVQVIRQVRFRPIGDVLGVCLCGLLGFCFVCFVVFVLLFVLVWDVAQRIMKDNPKLVGERGEALRCLLYLFERDEAVPLIGAG